MRLVDVFAKRFQVQEKMTAEIASCLQTVLKPHGVAVVIQGTHQCMTTRGVHKSGATMVTSQMLGVFRDHIETRQEFLAALDLKVRDVEWAEKMRCSKSACPRSRATGIFSTPSKADHAIRKLDPFLVERLSELS